MPICIEHILLSLHASTPLRLFRIHSKSSEQLRHCFPLCFHLPSPDKPGSGQAPDSACEFNASIRLTSRLVRGAWYRSALLFINGQLKGQAEGWDHVGYVQHALK